jgi:hypothetical protein
MQSNCKHIIRLSWAIVSTSLIVILIAAPGVSQDTVTGAFLGRVTNSLTGEPISRAAVEIINEQTGLMIPKTTDSEGRFYQGLLPPGIYRIRVASAGFQTREVLQRLFITRTGEVVPVPVQLDPAGAATATTTPTPAVLTEEDSDVRSRINTSDARRGDSFTEIEVVTLPLGGTTLTRSFDELALLLPGVAPPPQTIGNVAGPGVGAGVGSAGQFSVNGLRSRGNNFTVDGSDNNDEDIGVRRQGFVALVPQPIESIQEYQVITLLAPAQFGRNLGAQVNAVSKSGGSETHGTVYGMFNSSQLNARNFFDTDDANTVAPLRTAANQPVLLDGQSITVHNQSGGEDSFTAGQAGFVLGGPIKQASIFYFVSAEGQRITAAQEESFAVPTVEQRGLFRSGASGVSADPFTGAPTTTIPVSRAGSDIFNLFPFPNNSSGIYDANTFTQVLPANAQGKVFSIKLDGNFKIDGRQQSITERYNFTDDSRDITSTGGAIFSSLRPRVRTQNNSFFLNSELTDPNALRPVFNQVRLSYGRTRLIFDEVRDREFLVPSARFPNMPFLLNSARQLNVTMPSAPGVANSGPVNYRTDPQLKTVEEELGALGQVVVAGFSPLGVDVYNFPQRRINNTYQLADDLTWRVRNHSLVFGSDVRRTELNSDLPRNARPLVTFNGAPRLILESNNLRLPTANDLNQFVRPEDLVALGAASNFFLTLNTAGDDQISLRYYQLNFFAQDAWRARHNLTLSYGLRYEYNTPVRELNQRVENTFTAPSLSLVPGLNQFIDGRTTIFEPDRNNFAPRVGVAYAPNFFGRDRFTVLRAGYGIFYDQILGAVASQSRNVFPTFMTFNFGGGASVSQFPLAFFNPASTLFRVGANRFVPLLSPGTVNGFNSEISLGTLLDEINLRFPNALGATLPARQLETPAAQHYSVTFEQLLSANVVVSAAYIGTRGHHLLRFTTPNLGPGVSLGLTRFDAVVRDGLMVPRTFGIVNNPARPVSGVGTITRFETTASSRYDSLQLQLRGRFRQALQYQVAYTLSEVTDEVSDVFDLAGASALPQNSLTLAGERGPANFDVRHRLAYNFIYNLPPFNNRTPMLAMLDGLQIAGTARLQTGQPFTVNSIFDVNLDGNLTDRLNTTKGLITTGDRRQPLRLATDNTFALLAPFGQDGALERNSFRAGGVIEIDLAITKQFSFSNRQSLLLRTDIFNVINRSNFGVPVRFLEAPGFGEATSTVTPGRRVQFALKYLF